MEEIMNFRQIRIEQMKEKDCVDNRTIWLDESIDGESEFIMLKMFDKIVSMDKAKGIKPKDAEPIHIKISSYGGDSSTCFSIVDKITRLRENGYLIYGYAYGKCMSSAFKIFISCSKRFAQPSCDLMCQIMEYGVVITH